MAPQSEQTPPTRAVLTAQINVKKAYRKPQLNNFGTITELTASGSMGGVESNAMSPSRMP